MSVCTSSKIKEIKTWYIDGQIWAHAFLRDGKFEGKRKTWHRNGMLESYEFYWNDKFEGKREEWYADGHPLLRMLHRGHKMEGEYKRWRQDGYIWTYQFYQDDQQIDECFTLGKKLLALRIKRLLRNRASHLPNTMIIPDLAQYVILNSK